MLADREGLVKFYDQYKNNLREESAYEDKFRNCQSPSGFIDILKERSLILNHLYLENESLLDTYLRPLLDGKVSIDDDIAQFLLEQAMDITKNYREDYTASICVYDRLEEYYKDRAESNPIFHEKRVLCLINLARYFNQLSDDEYYHKSLKYFDELYEYKNKFYDFENRALQEVYRSFIVSRGIGMGNCPFVTIEQTLAELDKVVVFMEETKDWDYIPGHDANHAATVKSLITMTIFAKLLCINTVSPQSRSYQRCLDYMETYYEEERRIHDNIFDISAPVFISYHKLCWLMGFIPVETLFDRYFRYYMNNSIPSENENLEIMQGFLTSQKYFSVMNLIPEMFMILRHSSEIDTPYPMERQQLMYDFIKFIKTIGHTGKESFLCQHIYADLIDMLPVIREDDDAYNLIYQVFITRDIDALIHSMMVRKIVNCILDLVYDKKPELLIGCLGCVNTESVLKHREDIYDYMEKGSSLHDIGKICLNFITKTQTRRLDQREVDDILKHPELGASLAYKSHSLRKYIPLIMGHHRFYDDSTGYPKNYRYKEHENAFLVNILQLADCLDAATDSIGRSYKQSKSVNQVLEEFKKDAGFRYNGELISLMAADKDFVSAIEALVTAGRVELIEGLYDYL